jgi:hypothetical protein
MVKSTNKTVQKEAKIVSRSFPLAKVSTEAARAKSPHIYLR